jgi:hypothetical protein
MLEKIVSISGKPGLFKVLSQGKNMLVVESIIDKKRMPAYASEKVVSLGDISMFTDSGDKPLSEILEAMKIKENCLVAGIDVKADAESLRNYFGEIVPDFDRQRVYPTDIKKLILWYNMLIENGLTDFLPEKTEEK